MKSNDEDYWKYLPIEVQSKILSYFKFNVDDCLKLMRVSKSFKRCIELIHIDIYNISLGLCSKTCWRNKTLPLFNEMIQIFELFLNVPTFNRFELMEVYTEGSLFRTFLHFFYCKRSCDSVNDYCQKCSHVRFRNFQNQVLFDDVLLSERDFRSKLGLDDRVVDFDVFLPNCMKYIRNEENVCRRESVVQFAADIYVLFVSTFIRINLNVYYDYFLKLPLNLKDEKYIIRHIQHLVRDLSNVIWELNVNYFFVIFEKFTKLNHSVCYDSVEKAECSYEPLVKKKQYYGQLVVVSNSNLRSSACYTSESESEF